MIVHSQLIINIISRKDNGSPDSNNTTTVENLNEQNKNIEILYYYCTYFSISRKNPDMI